MTKTSTERDHEDTPRAAVFLDRDGTIIEDCGDLFDPSQVVFLADTVSSLSSLCERFDLFIVTNQSGVAKGTISMQAVERVNAHIVSHLAQHGVPIIATYVCPHERTSGCHCIKPNSYFLKKAEADFRSAQRFFRKRYFSVSANVCGKIANNSLSMPL